MKRFEPPLMWIALIFCVVMAALGWLTIAHTNWDPAAVVAGVFGTVASAVGVWGWHRRSLYLMAGAALGAGIAFPTTFGIVPMIAGFAIFALLVSLRLFNDLDLGKDLE